MNPITYFKNCHLLLDDIKLPAQLKITDTEKILANKINNPVRKKQFLLGRHKAHLLLETIDYPLKTINKNKNGSLDWSFYPKVKGSLSHCKDKVAVCISDSKEIQSIGIDLENTERHLIYPILQKITNSNECNTNENATTQLEIFCLKEAVIKAFGQLNYKLGFKNIQILSLKTRCFSIPCLKLTNQYAFLEIKENIILAAFILRGQSHFFK